MPIIEADTTAVRQRSGPAFQSQGLEVEAEGARSRSPSLLPPPGGAWEKHRSRAPRFHKRRN